MSKKSKRKSVVASVGGGLSIAVGPWQLIAADRRLAAESLGGDPPSEILLIPSPQWVLEDITLNTPRAALDEVVAEIEARGIDIHCDYHHQSLYAAKTGIQAPAAGWAAFSGFRVDAKGLWATSIRWTAAADAYLRNGEYRYISPVVYFEDKTLEVTSLDSWALTNTPRSNDQPPLTAALAAERFASRRVAASKGAFHMDDFLSILMDILGRAYWGCYDDEDRAELLGAVDKARAQAELAFAAGAKEQAAADTGFAAKVPKGATILQALIASGLKLPEGAAQTQLAAAAPADTDEVPANLLTIVDLPAGTRRPAFAAHLVSLMTERVPRSELVAAQTAIAAARTSDEKRKVDDLLVKFADRYNQGEEPELRRIAASSPENLAAIEANLAKRAPVVLKPASRDNAPAPPQLAAAPRVMVAGESRPATEDGSSSHTATMQILAEKGWGMSRYAEANEIRHQNELAASRAAK
ncbi:MAG TPA: phage protease [Thermoanaerobaculia bacterium]|nr:phage protease [Thermoanaerobaculia bacterium]